MKHLLASLMVIIIALPVHAQSDTTRLSYKEKREIVYQRIDSIRQIARDQLLRDKKARLVDSLMTVREERSKKKVDSDYILKPNITWTLKFRATLSGNTLIARSTTENGEGLVDLNAARKGTLSFSIGYRGITLGVTMNPRKWAGKNKDFEYNLNSYSNRYGFDVMYTTANTFTGTYRMGDEKYSVEAGQVRQKLFTIDGYYAFNYKKFSYPAAFSQNQIQKHSAGSILLSTMFVAGSLRQRDVNENPDHDITLHTGSWGIGGGYGYNLVLPHSWMLHSSVTPMVVVLTHSRLYQGDTRVKMPYHFPNFMTVGRFGVVHNWERYFAGATAVFNYFDTGDYDHLRIFQIKWLLRAFVGVRI